MPIPFLFLPPQGDKTRDWARRLGEAVPELEIIAPETMEGAEQAIAMAEGAYGTIPPNLLARADKLRWLQAPQAAPPAGFYYPELIAHPVVITNFREIYNDHIAAHIMSFVLAFARGLQVYIPQQLRREWRPMGRESDDIVTHLPEATALIVGVGGIGAETARLAASFGMKVIGVDERRTDKPAGVAELHRAAALDDLLPRADFVILTVPHTPETEGFMNRDRFRRMKSGAFFINIGRGMTTRLDDLVAALRAGEIAGAALDVFEQEPLPPDHPLWTMPGVLITPHTAGHGPYLDERRYRGVAGQRPALRRRTRAAQHRRQVALVLRQAISGVVGIGRSLMPVDRAAHQWRTDVRTLLLSAAGAVALAAFASSANAQTQCWWTGYGYSCAAPPVSYYEPPPPLWTHPIRGVECLRLPRLSLRSRVAAFFSRTAAERTLTPVW